MKAKKRWACRRTPVWLEKRAVKAGDDGGNRTAGTGRMSGLAEETQQGFLLIFVACQAGNLAGHLADHARDRGVGKSERLGSALHFAHGKVVIGGGAPGGGGGGGV